MVNSIISSFKVYKDTTSKNAFVAGLLNFICYISYLLFLIFLTGRGKLLWRKKEKLRRYASGFALICWLIFSTFVEILFGPRTLFVFICFIVELTCPHFLVLKRMNWLLNFPGNPCNFHLYEQFFIEASSNCHEEVIKGISQDVGARFNFVIYFYRFDLLFVFFRFFDIYNGSYSIPCSFRIIFVFPRKCLVKICLIDFCKFVNEVFVIFEFLEKCFFTNCFLASIEFAVYAFFA